MTLSIDAPMFVAVERPAGSTVGVGTGPGPAQTSTGTGVAGLVAGAPPTGFSALLDAASDLAGATPFQAPCDSPAALLEPPQDSAHGPHGILSGAGESGPQVPSVQNASGASLAQAGIAKALGPSPSPAPGIEGAPASMTTDGPAIQWISVAKPALAGGNEAAHGVTVPTLDGDADEDVSRLRAPAEAVDDAAPASPTTGSHTVPMAAGEVIVLAGAVPVGLDHPVSTNDVGDGDVDHSIDASAGSGRTTRGVTDSARAEGEVTVVNDGESEPPETDRSFAEFVPLPANGTDLRLSRSPEQRSDSAIAATRSGTPASVNSAGQFLGNVATTAASVATRHEMPEVPVRPSVGLLLSGPFEARRAQGATHDGPGTVESSGVDAPVAQPTSATPTPPPADVARGRSQSTNDADVAQADPPSAESDSDTTTNSGSGHAEEHSVAKTMLPGSTSRHMVVAKPDVVTGTGAHTRPAIARSRDALDIAASWATAGLPLQGERPAGGFHSLDVGLGAMNVVATNGASVSNDDRGLAPAFNAAPGDVPWQTPPTRADVPAGSSGRTLDLAAESWRENLREMLHQRTALDGGRAAGESALTLRLHPRGMGSVNVTVAMGAANAIQLRFGVISERSRRFFHREAGTIAASFARAGVNVSRIEVVDEAHDT